MSGVATAIVGSAVIGGISSSKSAKAQESAAETSAEASKETSAASIALQKELAAQSREDLSPWREAGESALSFLKSKVNSGYFNTGDVDVTQDPSYQFRMSEGIDALDKSAASRGRLLSGAQQQAVTDYSQNLASTEYANAYARQSAEKTNEYNMLANLSSSGQSAAAGQASTNSQLASSAANTYSNLGTSLSNSAYAAGQAQANAYTGYATAANTGIQNWLTHKNR